MNAELFSATILLILVIDPFGNVPLVVAALKNVAPERRVRVVLRECAAAYVILVGFMLGGRTFLQWLHLSEESLTIAGGIILFLIAHPDGVPAPRGHLRRSARQRSRSSCRWRFRRSPVRRRSRR